MKTIKVIRDKGRGYGYNLEHNQPAGFKGIIGTVWAWYRLKSDAIKAANELMNCWNKQTF